MTGGIVPDANEKLAASLTALRDLQTGGTRVINTAALTRTHRERLARHGFLQEIVKGWWIATAPADRSGDSTSWYASFWEFIATYATTRYADQWHLSAEHSLLYLAGATTVPTQVVIHAVGANNRTLDLPYGTSVFAVRREAGSIARRPDVVELDGLRVLSAAQALARVPDTFFQRYPLEAQLAIGRVPDVSAMLRPVLDDGRARSAGRLAGALRRVGRADDANLVVSTMRAAEHDVREYDPFDAGVAIVDADRSTPAIVVRIRAMWERHRQAVLDVFPAAPGIPAHASAYLDAVEDAYSSDAYNSLSIEGYTVSLELIERVRAGGWNPDSDPADRDDRDALAARGYWQTFQAVKRDIASVLDGDEPGRLVERTHRAWYRELFQPFVAAGVLPASSLAGYRHDAVYLRGARHVPPRHDVVPDAMAELFALLANEPEPAVRAVLGHWLFGYIHPFPDGNGRIARFLMNVMLASGGYPWLVILHEDRYDYLASLDALSAGDDARPFTQLLVDCARRR